MIAKPSKHNTMNKFDMKPRSHSVTAAGKPGQSRSGEDWSGIEDLRLGLSTQLQKCVK